MSKPVDLYLVYQFLRRLTTPFDETDAYELGLIDDKGNNLKSPKTSEEKDAYGTFDKLVFNIKKLLAKVPGGRSRLASYAAALYLIRENEKSDFDPEDMSLIKDGFMREMTYLSEDNYSNFLNLVDRIDEDTPANAVGSGNVAGAAPGEDPPIGANTQPLLRRSKKKKNRKSFTEYHQIDELRLYKPEPKNTLGVTRNRMPQIKSAHLKEFQKFLTDNGVKLRKERVPVKSLKETQKEFSDKGIVNMIASPLMSKGKKKPIIASSDDYILDGHHRVLAMKNTNMDMKIDVIRVDVKINKLLKLAREFPKTTYKSVY